MLSFLSLFLFFSPIPLFCKFLAFSLSLFPFSAAAAADTSFVCCPFQCRVCRHSFCLSSSSSSSSCRLAFHFCALVSMSHKLSSSGSGCCCCCCFVTESQSVSQTEILASPRIRQSPIFACENVCVCVSQLEEMF